MTCEPCRCGAGCAQVVTPEGLLCRDCAADLAAHLRPARDEEASR